MDAAEYQSIYGIRYRIGFFDGVKGQVYECPSWVSSQQVAELSGVWVLARVAARGKMSQAAMLQDNMQAVWNTINLISRAGLWRQNRILRAIVHQLRRSGLILHVLHIPSDLQPADPLSRVTVADPECIAQAVTVAKARWNQMLLQLHHLEPKGLSFVSV